MNFLDNKKRHATISESGKSANVILLAVVAAVGLFSAYVLFTTENTTIVINKAAEPRQEAIVNTPPPAPEPQPNPRVEILATGVGFLNVRDSGSLQGTKVGQVTPGEVYEYTQTENDWYKLVHPTIGVAWVSGQYVREVNRSEDLFGE